MSAATSTHRHPPHHPLCTRHVPQMNELQRPHCTHCVQCRSTFGTVAVPAHPDALGASRLDLSFDDGLSDTKTPASHFPTFPAGPVVSSDFFSPAATVWAQPPQETTGVSPPVLPAPLPFLPRSPATPVAEPVAEPSPRPARQPGDPPAWVAHRRADDAQVAQPPLFPNYPTQCLGTAVSKGQRCKLWSDSKWREATSIREFGLCYHHLCQHNQPELLHGPLPAVPR